MAITVKHTKVSAIPDGDDTTVVRPSDWNADHQLVGTVPVANGGTGASTLTGYVKGNGTSAMTAVTTVPSTDITGLGTMATQNANAVAVTGGSINNTAIGDVTPNTGSFTTLNSTGASNIGTATTTQTTNIANGVTATGQTNSVNIGTAGASGSTTNIAVGSSVGTSTTTVNGGLQVTGLNQSINIGSGQTTGGIFIGGTGGSGAITIGRATTSQAINLGNSVTATGQTNTIAVGTAGASGSTTAITIGSALGASSTSIFGAVTTNNSFTFQNGVTNITATNLSTGSFTVGGASQTGTNTFGQSTLTGITNIASGATASGSTKSVNIGTNGLAGSTTNIAIGSTAGTSTTTVSGALLAQTEVLRGTGQNLLVYSQALATAGAWFNGGATVTNNTTDVTDPLGGNTATKIVGSGSPNVSQYINLVPVIYTYSIYLRTLSGSVSARILTFLSNPPYTAIGSSSITVTSAWQRFTFTTTAPPSASVYAFQIDSFGANTIYAWGAQQEIGSVANTYIPTTTTAIYGTPTLSFSGVAGLGLQSDGSLYVSPAGTGALQAQATDSAVTGGNARGANAVDWQTSRSAANQVASGFQCVIGGGTGNTSSGYQATVGGGNANGASGSNTFIGAGFINNCSGAFSTLVGGYGNTSTGNYNFVGGGALNAGTSASAVTTQSATMNGTTAVTLSGSNANIKVGQYITGTSINGYPATYVAAISGTSLTLSQNASGSSTSTLSFYTPHGVVVGGGNNQASGSYSFIGGGGDAGVAANRNVASGDWSFVGGGGKNVASGAGSAVVGGGNYGSGTAFSNSAVGVLTFIGGGWNNYASGSWGVVAGGQSNQAINTQATVAGGNSNIANGTCSAIMGGSFGTARGITGSHVFPACNTPISSSNYGISQTALLVLGRETTNATATVLTSDTGAASGTNQVILPNNSAYYFKVSVIAGVTGGGNTKAWTLEGAIKRGANAGSTAIVGTVTTTIVATDAGASTWTVTATADTTNGGLAITFTGQAATTIRVVAKADTTEMTY